MKSVYRTKKHKQAKQQIAAALRGADRVAISSHVRPDADSIGGGLGLYLMLKGMGKSVAYMNTDSAPFPLSELPCHRVISIGQIYPTEFDAVVLIEGGSEDRTGQKNLDNYFTINIDHHASNSQLADLNWVVPEAAAIGELIYELGLELEVTFTREIAMNLYAAIISDTGSFKYSNTSSRSFYIVSQLIETGKFAPYEISDLLFNSNPLEKIRMIPRVLSTLEMHLDNRLSIIEFHRDFLENIHLKAIETEDIIALARSITGVQVTLFFKEIAADHYRVSVRSKGAFSSKKLAQFFGGGGHDHAAGFFYRGNIKEAKQRLVTMIGSELSTL